VTITRVSHSSNHSKPRMAHASGHGEQAGERHQRGEGKRCQREAPDDADMPEANHCVALRFAITGA